MKNTWEAKREKIRQKCTILCRVKKKFGRTDEARGGDDIASASEFFNGYSVNTFLNSSGSL
jgi:hypothetical protein